jgi:stearoyl-CoA desaturase (delta-9 desaturase)
MEIALTHATSLLRILLYPIDSYDHQVGPESDRDTTLQWRRLWPFVAIHLLCLSVFWVGFSWFAFGVFAVSYLLRTLGITVGYHRLLAHRSFKAGRGTQFALACLGNAAMQRGPLWWAAHHRHHHQYTDAPEDHHSPVQHGFWRAHIGWVISRAAYRARLERIPDFARFKELRFLDRYDALVPLLYGALMYGVGAAAAALWPDLGTSGLQTLVWGGALATVCLLHATFTINSLAHLLGSRPYPTNDHSRNIALLAPLTGGESWHNNHHHFPASARLGFRWWQLDPGWYLLLLLRRLGLVYDVRVIPDRLL